MTTYYVDPVSGSDGNAGTSFGAAWATTQKAFDTVTDGDEVRLCATGTETPSASIFKTGGLVTTLTTAVIKFIAYDATGTSPLPRGQYYTISGSSLPASTTLMGSQSDYITRVYFQNIRLTSATGSAYSGDTTTVAFYRCSFDNAGDEGVACADGSALRLIDCDIYDNAAAGVRSNANRGAYTWMVNCRVYGNGSYGLWPGHQWTIENCYIYGNTNAGIYLDAYYQNSILRHNTIVDNTGDGIYHNRDSSGPLILDNIIAFNSAYAIEIGNEPFVETAVFGANLIHGNTSGSSNSTRGGLQVIDDLTSDPLFTNLATDDFTLQASSPAIGAASDGGTIGAYQAAGSGGSGQRVVMH